MGVPRWISSPKPVGFPARKISKHSSLQEAHSRICGGYDDMMGLALMGFMMIWWLMEIWWYLWWFMVINGDFINKNGGYDDINGNYPLVNRQKTMESHHLHWVNRCNFDWAMAGRLDQLFSHDGAMGIQLGNQPHHGRSFGGSFLRCFEIPTLVTPIAS